MARTASSPPASPGRDVKQHETVFGQIHGLLDICQRRVPQTSVPDRIDAQQRVQAHFEQRLDFAFIRDRVLAGDCGWVALLQGRPNRAVHTGARTSSTNSSRTPTRACSLRSSVGRSTGRNESDMLLLNTLEQHGPVRGWAHQGPHPLSGDLQKLGSHRAAATPAPERVGFKRDAGDWLVVDALQWPAHQVRFHMEFANSGEKRRYERPQSPRHSGGARIQDQPRQAAPCSCTTRIYVDGEWSVRYKGVDYPGRTIPLPDPVPAGGVRTKPAPARDHGRKTARASRSATTCSTACSDAHEAAGIFFDKHGKATGASVPLAILQAQEVPAAGVPGVLGLARGP